MTAALYALICLIWGSTWVAIKVGLIGVPPFLSARVRFLLAKLLVGLVLITLIISIVALALGRAFLNETVTPLAFIGIAMILAGVAVAIVPAGARRVTARAAV